jgi:hypothetical protein
MGTLCEQYAAELCRLILPILGRNMRSRSPPARRRLGILVFACKQPSAYETANLSYLQLVATEDGFGLL